MRCIPKAIVKMEIHNDLLSVSKGHIQKKGTFGQYCTSTFSSLPKTIHLLIWLEGNPFLDNGYAPRSKISTLIA